MFLAGFDQGSPLELSSEMSICFVRRLVAPGCASAEGAKNKITGIVVSKDAWPVLRNISVVMAGANDEAVEEPTHAILEGIPLEIAR